MDDEKDDRCGRLGCPKNEVDKPINNLLVVQPCQHQFCGDCLEEDLLNQIENRVRFQFVCVACQEQLSEESIVNLLSKLARFRNAFFKQRDRLVAEEIIESQTTDIDNEHKSSQNMINTAETVSVNDAAKRKSEAMQFQKEMENVLKKGDIDGDDADLAVIYLTDALHYRSCKLRPSNAKKGILFGFTRMQLYRFSQEWYWVEALFFMIWVNMLKAIWEPPSVTKPGNVTMILEILFLLMFLMDLGFKYFAYDAPDPDTKLKKNESALNDNEDANMAKLDIEDEKDYPFYLAMETAIWRKIFIVITIVHLLFVIIVTIVVNTLDNDDSSLITVVDIFLFSRIIRPLYMLHRSRTVWSMFVCVVKSIFTKDLFYYFLTLTVLFWLLFALIGYYLFGELNVFGENDYFSSFGNTFYSLIVLQTTSNYPDVMLESFYQSEWASIFFLIYNTFGILFLMSLVLAVVYDHYSANIREKDDMFMKLKNRGKEKAFGRLAVTINASEGKKIYCKQFCDMMEHLGATKRIDRKLFKRQYFALLGYKSKEDDNGMTFSQFCEFHQLDQFLTEESDDIYLIRNVAISLLFRRAYHETRARNEDEDDTDNETDLAENKNDVASSSPSPKDNDSSSALQRVTTTRKRLCRCFSERKQEEFRLWLIKAIWGNPLPQRKQNDSDKNKSNSNTNSNKSNADNDNTKQFEFTLEFVVHVIIVLNIILLVIDLFLTNLEFTQIFNVVDIFVIFIFMVEILLKIIALGYRAYFFQYLKDFVNFIDFAVTIVLFITEILLHSWFYSFVVVLRTFKFIKFERVLKICKLLKIIGKFPEFLKSAKKTFVDGISIFVVLFCLCYIFAVIGCYVYQDVITEDVAYNNCISDVDGNDLTSEFWCEMYDSFYFANNFNTFISGFMIQVVMIIGNNWDIVAKMYLLECEKSLSLTVFTYLYFLTVYFTVLLIINVLTAFIIDVFDDNYRYFRQLTENQRRIIEGAKMEFQFSADFKDVQIVNLAGNPEDYFKANKFVSYVRKPKDNDAEMASKYASNNEMTRMTTRVAPMVGQIDRNATSTMNVNDRLEQQRSQGIIQIPTLPTMTYSPEHVGGDKHID